MFTANPGRWLRYLVTLIVTIVLAACGGSTDDAEKKNVSIRVINATADIESIDLSREGLDDANNDDGELRLFGAVARDGKSDYATLAEGRWSLRLKRADASSSLTQSFVSLAGDKSYTMFAYGRDGSYKVVSAVEEEDEPSSGRAKVRVLHALRDRLNVNLEAHSVAA